ncbi:hypothetical protein Plhal703r1_c01g0001021 [Plasmopara halstedii]
MEAKATHFLTQFSRVVFQQWTQTPEHEKFWEDSTVLHAILEEAVAKLPSRKLKAHLSRNLTPLGTQLAKLLRDLHASFIQEQHSDEISSSRIPLNEIDTELELTQSAIAPSIDKQRKLAGVLALDAGIDIARHPTDTQNCTIEELAQLFAIIAARRYESLEEQEHKRGLVLRILAARVQEQFETLSKKWCRSKDADFEPVKQLRTLLERIVVQDVVAIAQDCTVQQGASIPSDGLKAPWTMFYRPKEINELKQVVYHEEVAKIYGALLALAIYYPISNESDEETSNESSEEDKQEISKQSLQSVVSQAQVTTRQVLFTAQMRERKLSQNGQWLVWVLSFLHTLAKPSTCHDKDGDETLDEEDRHALLDCLGQVYSRAFANVTLFHQAKDEKNIAEQDRALFYAVVCLRHASHFMRVESKSSYSAITTSMAHLAGVPLPASFELWLDHEQVSKPMSSLEKATQRLWKICAGQKKMINILLNSIEVTTEELLLIQESYAKFLDEMARDNLNKPKSRAKSSLPANAVTEVITDANSLFYVDNAGGEDEKKTKKSKKKRANKKKKKQIGESTDFVSMKRNRTLSK